MNKKKCIVCKGVHLVHCLSGVYIGSVECLCLACVYSNNIIVRFFNSTTNEYNVYLFIIPRQYKRTLALFTISAMWGPACHCRYILLKKKNTSAGHKITKAIVVVYKHTRYTTYNIILYLYYRFWKNLWHILFKNQKLIRFQELLLGDATKAKTVLGWVPKVNFEVNADSTS